MTSNTDRERGIEMNGLLNDLDPERFPVEKGTLLDEYGQHELGFADGESSTLESVLGPVGVEEFRSPDALLETIHQMVGQDAVGREGQTGRGTSDITPPSEQRPPGKPESDESR